MKAVRICSPHESHKELQLPSFSRSVRIRFGAVKKYTRCDVDFPSPKAIKRTTDKVRMKRILKRAGVKTPAFWVNNFFTRLMLKFTGLGRPVFRKGRQHSRGSGMQLCFKMNDALDADKGGYFEELMHAEREFRVHVCDGKVFYIDEKIPRREGHSALIKNLDNGYKYREPKTYIPIDVAAQAVKSVEALGLDFGAVDVGCNGSCVWVYEVNTAMGLRTKTRELYEQQLTALIHKKINRLDEQCEAYGLMHSNPIIVTNF